MNQDLVRAIENQLVIRLHYTEGYRSIEPYAYGLGTSGNKLLRGYQISGASESGSSTGWKLFKLDEISSLTVTEDTFSIRSQYKKGDKAMTRIYAQVE